MFLSWTIYPIVLGKVMCLYFVKSVYKCFTGYVLNGKAGYLAAADALTKAWEMNGIRVYSVVETHKNLLTISIGKGWAWHGPIVG
jgi:hypothetical protein